MILNFLIAPGLMFLLTTIVPVSIYTKISLLLLSIAPASSMGLGYLGLSGGDILAGATIVALAFILSLIVYPIAGYYFASGTLLQIPPGLIIKNLLLVLITSLILGILTREIIERKHGVKKFIELKPYFSTITLTGLYILLYLIFASKAKLVIAHYMDILLLAPIAILFYGTIIFMLIILNKNLFKLEYGHHQAVVFTTASKNVSITIAILISVFGKTGQFMAVYPAIMAIFQTPILITYLRYSDKIKNLFETMEKETHIIPKTGITKI